MKNNIFTSNKTDELLGLLSGYKTEKHTFEDKGYDFLDVGQCFITVRNPEEANNLSIKIGNEFTLFFGGWHKEYATDEGGFSEMVQALQSILNCSQCIYMLSLTNASRYTKEQFDKNIAKVIELVEMLPKKLGDFYKFIKENGGGDSDE